jgi:DNA-binding MarR family transcriptional regulator
MAIWLSDDEMAAWRGMVGVHASVMAELEAELLANHGLSSGDYGVLVALSEAPNDRLRMCDLASQLHLSPSGLTRRIDGMVKAGLVARTPSSDDRRVMLAMLTDEGRARLEQAAPGHVAGVRRAFLDHLTEKQIRNLGEAFAAVTEQRAAQSPQVRATATAN